MDFDTYINKNYNFYSYGGSDTFIEDTQNLFKNLKKSKTKLNKVQINSFVNKLTKGKSYCILKNTYSINGGIIALNELTKEHSLNTKQFKKILDNLPYNRFYNFVWVTNMINLDYKFLPDEIIKLISKGYIDGIDYAFERGFINADFMGKYLGTIEADINQKINILKKYDIIPDTSIFRMLMKSNLDSHKYYTLERKIKGILDLGYKFDENSFEDRKSVV